MNNFISTQISDCICCVRSTVREVFSRPMYAIEASMGTDMDDSLSETGIKVFAHALSSEGMSNVDVALLGAGENYDDGVPRIAFRNPNVIELDGDASVFSDDLPLIHAIKFTVQQDLPALEIKVRRVVPQEQSEQSWELSNRCATHALSVMPNPIIPDNGVSLILGSDQFVDMHYVTARCESVEVWASIVLHHLQVSIKKGWAPKSDQEWLAPVAGALKNISELTQGDLEHSKCPAAVRRILSVLLNTLTDAHYEAINRLVIRSVARCQKRWASRGSLGDSAALYSFVKKNAPSSITPELAAMFIQALTTDGNPFESQSEMFYALGDFKRALEARIKTAHGFDREAVGAEWLKVCTKQA